VHAESGRKTNTGEPVVPKPGTGLKDEHKKKKEETNRAGM